MDEHWEQGEKDNKNGNEVGVKGQIHKTFYTAEYIPEARLPIKAIPWDQGVTWHTLLLPTLSLSAMNQGPWTKENPMNRGYGTSVA